MQQFILIAHDWRVLFAGLITALINILMLTTGAARLAGVYTKRIATSLTLFNLFGLLSRLANLMQSPILGSIADKAANTGNIHLLELQMRFIILFSTVGAVIGTFLIPSFVRLYQKGIIAFERLGSIPKVLLESLKPKNVMKIADIIEIPKFSSISKYKKVNIPKHFLIYNALTTAIWTIGVLSAIFASAALPKLARTATLLSGIVNGIATVLFTLVVDPTAAIITDQAAEGSRPVEDVKTMVFWLAIGNIVGTIIAQFIFIPAEKWIEFITKIVGG